MPLRHNERAYGQALALRANGFSIRAIAQRIGVSRATVGGWLHGRGEWSEFRTCQLCGERFVAGSGAQRFCTPEHADKHHRAIAAPRAIEAYRQRPRELEAELTELCARLSEPARTR
jgi:hypothetical protein